MLQQSKEAHSERTGQKALRERLAFDHGLLSFSGSIERGVLFLVVGSALQGEHIPLASTTVNVLCLCPALPFVLACLVLFSFSVLFVPFSFEQGPSSGAQRSGVERWSGVEGWCRDGEWRQVRPGRSKNSCPASPLEGWCGRFSSSLPGRVVRFARCCSLLEREGRTPRGVCWVCGHMLVVVMSGGLRAAAGIFCVLRRRRLREWKNGMR